MKKGTIEKIIDYYYENPEYQDTIKQAIEQFFDINISQDNELVLYDELEDSRFNEWLIFDYQQNNGTTLLEDFISNNPLNLTSSEIDIYKDLLNNYPGFYEVLDIQRGQFLLLRNLQTSQKFSVQEKLATFTTKLGDINYFRVAKVENHWEIVSGSGIKLPIKITGDFLNNFKNIKEKLNPKIINDIFYRPNKSQEDEQTIVPDTDKDPLLVEKEFEQILKKNGLNQYVNLQIVKEWIYNQSGPLDATSMLVGLLLKDESYVDSIPEVVKTMMNLHNVSPQKFLKGKSPFNLDSQPIGSLEWIDYHSEGMKLFVQNKQEDALKKLYRSFEILLEQKTTGPEIYRLYSNLAMVNFYFGKDYIGKKLNDIALELNPNYDFAQNVQKKYESGEIDKIIMRQRLEQLSDEKLRRELPLFRWDLDEIKQWSTENILNQLKEFGILITENEFKKKTTKFYQVKDFADKIFYPKYTGETRDEDFIWIAVFVLWQKLCPDQPCVDLLLEKFDQLSEEVFADNKNCQNTEKLLSYLLIYFERAPRQFFKAWPKLYDFYENIDCLKEVTSELLDSILENDIKKIITCLNRKIDHWQIEFLLLLIPTYHNKKVDSKQLKRLSSKYPYNTVIYTDIAQIFHRLNTVDQEEKYLKLALEIVKERETNKIYDVANYPFSIYQDYDYVLGLLETFYEDRQNEKELQAVKAKIIEIKNNEDKLSYSKVDEEKEQQIIQAIEDTNQKEWQQNLANLYYQFLKPFKINFKTESQTSTEYILFKPGGGKIKIGRNQPCHCGSGKKYKKCHGK